MTVLLGRFKRGDDWTSRAIVFTVDDEPVDLTAEGWSVAAQMRPQPDASDAEAVDLTVTITGDNNNRIILAIASDDSASVSPGPYVADVQVTGPTFGIDGGPGVRSSETFEIEVVADVTRPVEETP